MRWFKSKNHEIFIYESNKISLCNFDDKRYILPDGIHRYTNKGITTKYTTKIYQQEIDKIVIKKIC